MTVEEFKKFTLASDTEMGLFEVLALDDSCSVSRSYVLTLIRRHNINMRDVIQMLKKYKFLCMAHQKGALQRRPPDTHDYLNQCAVLCDVGFKT